MELEFEETIKTEPEVIKSRKFEKNKSDRNNSSISLLLWSVLLFGFLIGVFYIYVGGEQSLDLINDWFDKVIQQKSESGILNLFFLNLISSLIYILVIYSLGFSPIFSLLISVISLLKGVGLGLSVTYVYINYGWRGIIYESLIDIPFNIIFMSILVLAAREAVKFSDGIYGVIRNKLNITISVSKYSIKFLIILIMLAITSFLNSLLDLVFFKYLNIL